MQNILQIINFRTFVITLCAVASTYLCIKYNITADFPLTLIATAVIFPIVFSTNGAYFAQEAAQYSPYVTYVMPVLYSLVLVSLFNIQAHLENPFDGLGADDITFNTQEFLDRLHD